MADLSQNGFTGALVRLCEGLGIDGPSPTATEFSINFDGFDVRFSSSLSGNQLVLACTVGALSNQEAKRQAELEQVLKMNMALVNMQATCVELSTDGGSQALVLYRRLHLAGLQSQAIEQALESLLSAAELYASLFSDMPPQADGHLASPTRQGSAAANMREDDIVIFRP